MTIKQIAANTQITEGMYICSDYPGTNTCTRARLITAVQGSQLFFKRDGKLATMKRYHAKYSCDTKAEGDALSDLLLRRETEAKKAGKAAARIAVAQVFAAFVGPFEAFFADTVIRQRIEGAVPDENGVNEKSAHPAASTMPSSASLPDVQVSKSNPEFVSEAKTIRALRLKHQLLASQFSSSAPETEIQAMARRKALARTQAMAEVALLTHAQSHDATAALMLRLSQK